ncbi:MAG TPA: hypothetical protein VGZ22_30565 [Isosphaeraceae bacterium]|jgi:hypothetical protein|nr:hypothetical protein [Isosphaeraceae bacterium]
MKAVKQIIEYLRERGVLTLEQLQYLATHGFLPWEEIFGDEEPAAAQTPAPQPFLAEDEHDRALPRHRAGTGKKGVVHKGPVLEPEQICARLAEQFDDWTASLQGLVQVGRRIEPCTHWHEAAVAIRNAEPEQITRAALEGVSTRDPSLEALWAALSLEDYRDVIAEPGVHGPGVTAYRAILELADPAHLGKHAWLLKEDEVGAVANLRRAQRLLLEACGAAFTEQPDLFATLLRHDRGSMAYWAFVLLYASRRGEPGHRPWPTTEERWPPREPPDDAGAMRAWAQFIIMDPAAGPRFLIEHDAIVVARPKAVCRALAAGLSDLGTGPEELVLLLDQHGFPSADAEVDPDDTQATSILKLRDAVRILRQTVEQTQLLLIPADADAIRVWDAFLESWLRRCAQLKSEYMYPERLPEMEEMVDKAFWPATNLFCPKSWDRRGRS